MAVTPKFNIRRLEPGDRPRVDLDINAALDMIDYGGCSSLVSGLADERPTSGIPNGLYYYETDTQRFLRYNGSSWIVIHPAPNGSISGASIDPLHTLSGRNFDFSSSLVWTPLAPVLRWPWVVGFTTPEWARDHMGIVYFRGNLRVNYVGNPGYPLPPPSDDLGIMFEFSSTATGGGRPPDPHGVLYDAFSYGQSYASMKIPTSTPGSHFYIREYTTEAVPPNPTGRLVRGLAVYNYTHNQYVSLDAITYST